MSEALELTDREIETMTHLVESGLVNIQALYRHLLAFHQETPISIRIPIKELNKVRNKPFSYDTLQGKAVLKKGDNLANLVQVDCFVASGKWRSIRTQETQEVDIINHLPELLPQSHRRQIGVFTAQNGIQNSVGDFKRMCEN